MHKKEKINRNIYLRYLFLVSIISIIICSIIYIYAIFQSEVNGNVNIVKGVWQIKVNNTDISNGVNKEFLVDNIQIQENEHVKEENLAPGLSGTFNISIQPENTDVSVKYEVSLDQKNLTNSNITIKSIKETVQGKDLIKTSENTYTGLILLDEIEQGISNNIEVEVEWKDNELNNEEDIKIGTQENYKLEIPIIVHITQYLGEEIIAYE